MMKAGVQSEQGGFFLLEALIAVLIFSMGVLAVVGLQAAMVRNSGDARARAEASFIAQRHVAAIWADPANPLVLEAAPGTDISDLLPNGRRITTQTGPGEYLITVTWETPGEDYPVVHSFVTRARVGGV